MYRKSWDVQDLIGQHACVRLIDDSSKGWCHINFDDLNGDIACPQDWGQFQFQGYIGTTHVVNEIRFTLHGFKLLTGDLVEVPDRDDSPPQSSTPRLHEKCTTISIF